MLFYHSIFTVQCIGGLQCDLLITIFLIMIDFFFSNDVFILLIQVLFALILVYLDNN